jgi:hypothetical protein
VEKPGDRGKIMWLKRCVMVLVLHAAIMVSDVYADGCFVWRKGADLNEPSQKAIIYWQDSREVLILQVKYEGPAEDFAWIVPLPAQPKVTAIDADKSPFAEISLYTQLRHRWGGRGKSGAAAESEESVTVLERKIVGVYDIAVLWASKAGALNRWLNKNGYAFPAERSDLLEHYTKKNWVYVAMRIDRSALASDELDKLKVGELQPICFAFESDEMVYPLKISSINAGETELLLYLLADTPMVAKAENKGEGLSIEQNLVPYITSSTIQYADFQYGTYRKAEKTELPLTWDALGITGDIKLSLCKYRSVYSSQEMTDDIVFTRFEPIAYWRNRLSREPNNDDYLVEQDRMRAFIVLAWHDTSLIEEFAKDKHSENRQLAAIHPKASEELLLELAKDEDRYIKCAVAMHPNTSHEMLDRLVNDKSRDIREAVMQNPSVTTKLLEILSQDKDDYIRTSLVYRGHASIDVLRRLAHDESPDVRAAVASQSWWLIKLLEGLARDESPDVRAVVAGQSWLPTDLLEGLARDESPDVRRIVVYQSRLPEDLLEGFARDKDSSVRAAVARQSRLSIDLLKGLARDESPDVRAAVARESRLPIDLLEELARDNSAEVRRVVAWDGKVSAETLATLASDEDAEVRRAVARNPGTPPEVLRKLVEDKEAGVREVLARNPRASEDILSVLADDADYWVRWNVAENPQTPTKVLVKLSGDKNSEVSQRAKAHIKNGADRANGAGR